MLEYTFCTRVASVAIQQKEVWLVLRQVGIMSIQQEHQQHIIRARWSVYQILSCTEWAPLGFSG